MQEETFSPGVAKDITVAKVAGTPSSVSWAQAYNAGKLYAVASLEREPQGEEEEKEPLTSLGKDFLERLQKEYFSLENKDLVSIKTALGETLKELPQDIKISLAVGSIDKNVLYIFTLGGGEVFIKRGDKSGVLLSHAEEDAEIKSSSGFLENGDIVFLKTRKLKDIVPNETLGSHIQSADVVDIAESITPKIHGKGEANGAAACLILNFKKETESLIDAVGVAPAGPPQSEPPQPTEGKSPLSGPVKFFPLFLKNHIKLRGAPKGRRTMLGIAAFLVIVLILGIFLGIRNNQNAKTKALFADVYNTANEKYEEGKSLAELNETLAKENFQEAADILNQNKDKFKTDSEEHKRIVALLKNVNNELTQASQPPKDLDRSKLSISVQNGSGVTGAAAKASDFLKDLGYNVTAIGNADNEDYEKLTIRVKGDKKDYLSLIRNDLSKNYTIGTASSDLAGDSSTDAVIIIGK